MLVISKYNNYFFSCKWLKSTFAYKLLSRWISEMKPSIKLFDTTFNQPYNTILDSVGTSHTKKMGYYNIEFIFNNKRNAL